MWLEVIAESDSNPPGVTKDGLLVLPVDKPKRRKPDRKPLYHRGLAALLDRKDLTGLLLPFHMSEAGQFRAAEFLEHLRLHTDLRIACLPVQMVGEQIPTEEELVHEDPRYEKHLLQGLSLIESRDKANPLEETDLRDLVGEILKQPPSSVSRHDMANKWGPALLMKGLELLGHKPGVASKKLQLTLLEDLAYKVWDRQVDQAKILTSAKGHEAFTKHRKWLDNCNTTYRVLLVDDMLDKGWKAVYEEFFSLGRPNPVVFEYASSTVEALELIQNPTSKEGTLLKWDLVMLDLRLEPAETARAHLADADSIMELSGMKILQAIKEQDPTLPVILATASEKAYSYDAVLQEGADGYWIKDGPERVEQLEHVRSNTISLLKLVNRNRSAASDFRPVYRYGHEIIYLFKNLSEKQQNSRILSEFYKSKRDYERFMKNIQTTSLNISHKIDMLYAILHTNPSHYLEVMQRNNRWQLAFLISYSLINDFKLQLMVFSKSGRDAATGVKFLLPDKPIIEYDISTMYNGDDVNGLEKLYNLIVNDGKFHVHHRSRTARNQLNYTHGLKNSSAKKHTKEEMIDLCHEVLLFYRNLLDSIVHSAS